VEEFKRLLHKAEAMLAQGKIHLAELNLQQATDIYKGDFLENTYDAWVEDVRHELASLYRSALLMLGEIYLKKLDFDRAIDVGKRMLLSDPFSEEGHRFVLRTYFMNGERAKVIKQYKRCADLFKRELDCLPSQNTQILYKELLAQM
jgi:DNA-binding SARP family transcriptional activator